MNITSLNSISINGKNVNELSVNGKIIYSPCNGTIVTLSTGQVITLTDTMINGTLTSGNIFQYSLYHPYPAWDVSNSEYRSHVISVECCKHITTISDSTFNSYFNMKTLYNDNIISIGSYSLTNCQALTHIDSKKIQTIGTQGFASCKSLQYIELPNIMSIGGSGFYNCTALKEVDISERPDNLTSIPSVASGSFNSCTYPIKIKVPKWQYSDWKDSSKNGNWSTLISKGYVTITT